MAKCSKCGYENQETDLYCKLCYEVLKKKKVEAKPAEVVQPPEIEPELEEIEQPRKNPLRFIGKILLLIAVIGGILLFFKQNKSITSLLFFLKKPIIEQGTFEAGHPDRGAEYYYYVPVSKRENMPVLVNITGPSGNSRSCMDKIRAFVTENNFALLSVAFRFKRRDWDKKKSFQFPNVWSGQLLLDILDYMANKVSISVNDLYLFGFSSGAQFSHRFALRRSDICRAVAFHAPGGITLPYGQSSVKFFVTAGSADTHRAARAKQFVQSCKRCQILAEYKEYPGVGHTLTDAQVSSSLEFFKKVEQDFGNTALNY